VATLFFKPEDLETIKSLCDEGFITLSVRTVRELCRRKQYPGIKQGRDWKTTRAAVRAHTYKGANAAFRRLCA